MPEAGHPIPQELGRQSLVEGEMLERRERGNALALIEWLGGLAR